MTSINRLVEVYGNVTKALKDRMKSSITLLFNCRKCSSFKDIEHVRVRDVTLEEHGINKPYKGVYKCTKCGNEVILDNED